MKEVLLHIGMHKTGSSSIQNSLHNYSDETTHYASFHEANHSNPMVTLFSSDPYNFRSWKRRGLSKKSVDRKRKQYLEILEKDICNANYQRLIISAESIGTLSNEAKVDMVRFFQSRNCDVKIICFLRPPGDYVKSMLQQRVQGGLNEVSYINPFYARRLRAFTKLLPAENFFVRNFKEVSIEYGDIVRGFVSLCELDESNVDFVRVNESLSATTIKLLYRLNKLPISIYGTQERYLATIGFRKALDMAFPATSDDKLNGEILSGLLKPGFDSGLEFISKKFGIDFNVESQHSSLERCEEYLSDLAEVDVNKIVQILKTYKVPVNTADTIDEMLAALYIAIVREVSTNA